MYYQHALLFSTLLAELKAAVEVFWLRRAVRRKVLKRLASDCALHAVRIRHKAAELRAEQVRKRLDSLRASAASKAHGNRLEGVLEETEKVLAELTSQVDVDASDVDDQPALLQGGTLMQHQMQGLRWLVALTDNQMSGILADDMGLGKTVQALAFLGFLMEKRQESGPHLILVPFTMLSHWVDEFTTWLPSFTFVVFRGTEKQTLALKQEMVQEVGKVNVVLTTFETLVSHSTFLCSFPWYCIIADEGHRLKNVNTQVSKLCHDLPCRHRLLLTGTPVQNSLSELWSLLSFVAPQAFGSLEDFRTWFALPPPPSVRLKRGAAVQDQPSVTGSLSEEQEMVIIQRLHSVLRPFLLRRTKDLVLVDLPEKREVVLWVPMSKWQRALYNSVISRLREQNMMCPTSVMELRKAVNHPYHFLKGPSEVTERPENLFRASGKFEFLERMLPRLLRFGHKVLIFAQMTSLLDLLQKLLLQCGIKFTRIDGQMSLRQRKGAMSAFRSVPEVQVLMLTTRAGGLGLNLQVADTVILFDSDWNPQVDAQAMDRAHRIGQLREVKVVRLLTTTTLDAGLLARLGGKLDMERKVISAGNFEEASGDASRSDLLKELVHDTRRNGSSMGQAVATPLSEMNALLARSGEELAAFEAADEELMGPAAADEYGRPEGLAERLERCGRLLSIREAVPSMKAVMAPASSAKRRRTGKGPAGFSGPLRDLSESNVSRVQGFR